MPYDGRSPEKVNSRLSPVHLHGTLLACHVMPSGLIPFHAIALVLSVAISATMLPAQSPVTTANAERWLSAVKTPEFTAPATKESWEKQRTEIRTTLQSLLGTFPPRPAIPDVTTISREEKDGYVLEKFRFENGLGMTVPGYLFLPSNTSEKKSPAILYCHWHGGQYDIGKEEMLQTNATPVAAGPALAKLGYVVLGIDACCFGERNGAGPGGPTEKGSAGEMTAAKFQLWAGRTLWGVMVRDDLMALDYLCSRPEVDASRIGVTGISMGSTRSWWIMALDDRPRAAVNVACMTRYRDLVQEQSLKAHGIYYFVPGMLQHFDSEAVIALAAPRPMLFMTGDQDGGSPMSGVKTIEEKVKPIYQLHGAPDNFENVIYPGVGHVYLPEMWERTVKWMDQHVKSQP
jgi:dipeptidyl aminopeptidase/acylaminoacyl peptidase